MADWSDGMVAANGINIHYHRTGGEKPPMLLLHGVTDNGLCWTPVVRHLEDRFDVVMADARGHGKSDRLGEQFSMPLLAADAAGLIRALGLQKPVVYGHSMGAMTAIALAADYPELVRALILEDPPLRDTPMPRPPAEFVEARRKEMAEVRAMSAEERLTWAAQQNPTWQKSELGPWAQSKAEVDPAIMGRLGGSDQYPWRDALQRLQCPGLLITGDPEKAIVKPEVALETVALWQGGEVAHIEGAGHSIRRDRFPETMAAIDAFLAKLGD